MGAKNEKYISNLPPSRKLNLTRRHFVKATSALVGAGLLSSYGLPIYAASNVDEMMKMYKQANIDWESQKGSSIVLSGLEHPWMSSIEPLLPHFTKLTGIDVQIQKQSESEYVAEVPVKLEQETQHLMFIWFGPMGKLQTQVGWNLLINILIIQICLIKTGMT